jgi:magnesium-transporting ATPase (P-type)
LGWSALTFDEQDLRGVYVLGEPQILKGHLVVAAQDSAQVSEERKSQSPGVVTRLVSPLRRLFKRTPSGPKTLPSSDAKGLPDKTLEQAPAAQPVRSDEAVEQALPAQAVSLDEAVEQSPPAQPVPSDQAADGVEPSEAGQQRVPFLRRMARRVGHTLRRAKHEPEQPKTPETAAGQESVLLFAYRPEPVSLHDAEGNVQLPEGLIPLCQLSYFRRLRPEAVDIVRSLATTGVRIKVFSGDEPDQIVAMLQQAGLGKAEEERLLAVGIMSGRDLEQLSPQNGGDAPQAEWARAAAENTIFAQITPAQAGALVRALRESGESVAVVGDGVADLPALQQADLSIARQTSAQAARSVADIVMLGSSSQVLLQILYRGQAIVHGLLDILKLNLTQVFYLALLLAASGVMSISFPYAPAHGAPIGIITVALPSIGLALWAAPGLVNRTGFGRILTRFVAPAAVSISVLALIVYLYFMDRTGQVDYAQLAVAYTLIYAGLLLAVFIKPPRLSWRVDRDHSRRGDRDGVTSPAVLHRKREWRMVAMALFLGVATFFLPAIPAAQEYLDLYWLQQPADYGVVGLAVAGWALILGIVWRVIPPVPSGE